MLKIIEKQDNKVYSFEELGPATIRLCLPSGIGDISWIYSKIHALKSTLGREVLVYVAGDEPKRGGDFIQLLPNVKWGGYLHDRDSWMVHSQCLPSCWSDKIGLGPFLYPQILNISSNIHLEMAMPIKDWLPQLPIDYHYDIHVSKECSNEAEDILSDMPDPVFCVYVSNRDKDNIKKGGWSLWDRDNWYYFLREVKKETKGSFVFIGAEYDRDKTEDIMKLMKNYKTKAVIGYKLGTAICCMSKSRYFFSYPSGLGIIANVLRIPTLMLLPWYIKELENVYADPQDIANGLYRAWASPKMEDALHWWKEVGKIQADL